jgi:hypothetical protein
MVNIALWNKFLVWARKSALGHVALFEVIGFLPFTLVFLALFYSDGTLTLSWAAYTAFLSFLCMATIGLLCWFTFTRPLARKATVRGPRNRA